jgi:pantothenate kinase
MPAELSTEQALEAARTLLDEALRSGSRRMLGIAGAPGAGKSTLAARLARQLGAQAVLVPMDGFHLADVALERLGRLARKGAPDTFDAGGYVALLQRLRTARPQDAPVWAPMFERDLEQPLAGAIEVGAEVPLVITEGNYLLLEDGPFAQVRAMLDACWFVEAPEGLRLERLVARHERFGKSPQAAREWALGPDEHNARLVAGTRDRADVVVDLSCG